MMSYRALVIVARYPEPGRVKTRLAATIGAEEAARLYRAFLVDLAARFSCAARQDGYRLIWAKAPGEGDLRTVVGAKAHVIQQHGNDFAERLHNVCADLTDAGAREVVIIGSDSPHLPVAWVARAFGIVARGEVALGPAEDGGYYLIGVHARPSPPNLFLGIQMSTAHVLSETLGRAAALALPVRLLPTTFDVDEADSLPILANVLNAPMAEAGECPCTREELARLDARKLNSMKPEARAFAKR
jgi:rSAM/selenodomain-associated transferase 1